MYNIYYKNLDVIFLKCTNIQKKILKSKNYPKHGGQKYFNLTMVKNIDEQNKIRKIPSRTLAVHLVSG